MKNIQFEDLILFEDQDYIVINKPPLVSTLSERDTTRESILQLGKTYHPDLQAGHRLDKETSGAMVLAKNSEAYRHISIQFQKRRVSKIYHAISKGIHEFNNLEVKHPIAVSGRGNVRIDSLEGKRSHTIFNTLQVFRNHTLIACQPITGRMHQIRIHLACVKAPILADVLYGGEFTYLSELKKKFKLKKDTEELPLISRVALHAFSLSFANQEGATIAVEAPYPKDLRAFLQQLERYT